MRSSSFFRAVRSRVTSGMACETRIPRQLLLKERDRTERVPDLMGEGTGHFQDGGHAGPAGQVPLRASRADPDADPDQQFLIIEGLRQIVVRPLIHPPDQVLFPAPAGDHDDVSLAVLRGCAHPPDERDTIRIRQDPVHEQHIGLVGSRASPTLLRHSAPSPRGSPAAATGPPCSSESR